MWRASGRFIDPAANALDLCVHVFAAVLEGVIDIDIGLGEVTVAVYKYELGRK